MKKVKLIINDQIKEYDLLYTFDSTNTNNSYMICTDNSYGENGKLKTTAFIYYPDDKKKGLTPIEDQKDWKEVETFLNMMESDLNA